MTIPFLNPQNMVFARIEGERISYYRRDATSSNKFWDNYWQNTQRTPPKSYYAPFLKGYLGHGVLAAAFRKHLPENEQILEAGCGLAQYVLALRARGYNCIGLDFVERTIGRVKSIFPSLPITQGNILELPYDNSSIGGYISLGVAEHFAEGPSALLKEANRVVKRGGVLLISVPQVFKWRKQQANPDGTPVPSGFSFYQYAYTPAEFRSLLGLEGFSVIEECGYETHFAFRLRYPWFRKLVGYIPKISRLDLLLDRTLWGRDRARMRLFVAMKR